MPEEKTRVDFNAPSSLVEQADSIADVLDVSRTQLLIEALRNEIDELADDDGFRRRLSEAYYADRIEFDVVESILGTEDAMRIKLLGNSLDRDPPEPTLEGALPMAEEFYADDTLPDWTPEEDPNT